METARPLLEIQVPASAGHHPRQTDPASGNNTPLTFALDSPSSSAFEESPRSDVNLESQEEDNANTIFGHMSGCGDNDNDNDDDDEDDDDEDEDEDNSCYDNDEASFKVPSLLDLSFTSDIVVDLPVDEVTEFPHEPATPLTSGPTSPVTSHRRMSSSRLLFSRIASTKAKYLGKDGRLPARPVSSPPDLPSSFRSRSGTLLASKRKSTDMSLKSRASVCLEQPHGPLSPFLDVLVCITGCHPEDRDEVVTTLRARFDAGNVIKACGDGSVYYVFFRGEHTPMRSLFIRRTLQHDAAKCDFVVFAFTPEPCGFQPPSPAKLARFQCLATAHADRSLVTRICPLGEVEDLLSEEDEMPLATPTDEASEEAALLETREPEAKKLSRLSSLRKSIRRIFSSKNKGIPEKKEKEKEKVPQKPHQTVPTIS